MGVNWGFSVEYERRSTGTVLMDDKLSPYQSYYENVGLYESSPHGALRTLMVFSEPAGAAGFASHTLSRRDLKRRVMEIYVSSIRELRSGWERMSGSRWVDNSKEQKSRLSRL